MEKVAAKLSGTLMRSILQEGDVESRTQQTALRLWL